MKKIFFTLLSIATIAVACKSSKETTAATPEKQIDCGSMTVTYTNDIKSIMEANCTRCHNTNNKAGYNFQTLESVKKAGSNGFLLGTIKHEKGFKGMPYFAGKLDAVTINKIECWIKNGMPE